MTTPPLRVALCCGIREHAPGSFLRCLALAEELLSRGIEVVFVPGTSSAWAEAQLEARGIRTAAPPASRDAYAEILDRHEVAAVAVDPASELAHVCAAARDAGRTTLAVLDAKGDVSDAKADPLDADIVVDARIDAQERRTQSGRTVLTGPEYVMLRNDVLANRPISAVRRRGTDVPKVLVTLEGPGAVKGMEAVARMLVETGAPFDAVLVTSAAEANERAAAMPTAPGQRLTAISPGLRMHERAARNDVVIGTASDAAYEWLALGSALALVWSSEDEVELYRRLMVRRAVVGLGSLAGLGDDVTTAAEKAQLLLLDPAERSRLGESAWNLVDGRGRTRVVDALLDQAR